MPEPEPEDIPRSIVTTCQMFGIDPPRLLTEADIHWKYRGMPLVAAGVWRNVKQIQDAACQEG